MDRYLLSILLFDGLIWINSSYGKFMSGNFPEELGKTLTKFASQNPYPWFKDILLNQAIPQSVMVGKVVLYAEVLAAILIVLGIAGHLLNLKGVVFKLFLLKGLMMALVLNLLFWLASGWTSPSSNSLNLLMAFIELVGIIYCLKGLRR